MSRLQYSYNWLTDILVGLVGITGHRSVLKTANEFAVYQAIFLLFLFLLIRFWKKDDAGFIINQSIVIVLCYCLYLMLFHNYPIYLWSLNPGQSIQGRYIFPVIVPLLGVAAFYLTNYLKNGLTYILIGLISAFFIWGDFPYFQKHADSAWFQELTHDVRYHKQRGDFFKKQGDLKQAIIEYREAVRLAPDNAWYHRFLGDLYSETAAPEKALARYLAAIDLQPENAGFHYLAGRMFLEIGKLERGLQYYQNAVRLDPLNVWYHRFLGDLFRDMQRPTDAIFQYREALKLEPKNQYFHDQLHALGW